MTSVTVSRTLALLGSAAWLLASTVQAWPAADHPLDALSADEITHAVTLLRERGHADEHTRYPLINLLEPPKDVVLAWKPGEPLDRRAFLVVKKGIRTYEAVVDLTARTVDLWEPVEGVQPSILGEEWAAAQELIFANPEWQASMSERGYSSFENIFCESMSAGYFALEEEEGRRLLKMPCFDRTGTENNIYARPIEGLYTVVDLTERKVIKVIDTGAVPVSSPANPLDVAVQRIPHRAVDYKSLNRDVTIQGSQVSWGAWSFHLRLDRRAGPVLSLISYKDGERKRSIMYQGSIAEMFVPYMDPHIGWSYRTFMDAGEYGFGRLASRLAAGTDCPEDALYLDPTLPAENGVPYEAQDVICIFQRDTGSPLWRHLETLNGTYIGVTAVELVVRTIPTVGNYDYVIDWVFTQKGEIRIDIGATGSDAVKGVASKSLDDPTAEADTAHGSLVAPNLVAIYHDHFLSFRFDLDVDGQQNSFVRERHTRQELPADNPRRSIWILEAVLMEREGSISAHGAPELWRVANPNIRTALGYNPSFEIAGGHSAISLLSAEDWPQRRAAFSASPLWVTQYRPSELYAAGPYPNQSKGGGLPTYVADGGPVEHADVVVWYTMGFRHVTRPEDWPILPTAWHSVSLRPYGFFDRNPSVETLRPSQGRTGMREGGS